MVSVQALGFIFKSLSIKSVPYLPQVSYSLKLVIKIILIKKFPEQSHFV